MASTLLPLALSLLPSPSLPPSSLLPLLLALTSSLPLSPLPSPPEPLLVSLLSLPSSSLTPLLPALQSLLLGRYGSAHSLPVLASIAAHSPSSPLVPLAAQVQALSVAATLIAALRSSHSEAEGSKKGVLPPTVLASAFPDLMVALCHPVQVSPLSFQPTKHLPPLSLPSPSLPPLSSSSPACA